MHSEIEECSTKLSADPRTRQEAALDIAAAALQYAAERLTSPLHRRHVEAAIDKVRLLRNWISTG